MIKYLVIILLLAQSAELLLPDYEFIEISDFLVTEQGIFVADIQMARIYHFDIDGTLLTYVGRKGRGPGEYSYGPNKLTIIKNRIYAYDKIPSVLNIYDLSLELAEVRVDRSSFIPALEHFQYADSLMFIATTPLWGEEFGKYNISGELIHPIEIPDRSDWILRESFKGFTMNSEIVLVWKYVNRIDTFTLSGERKNTCKLTDLPDEVKHEIYKDDRLIPQGVTEKEASYLKSGIYIPHGVLMRNILEYQNYLLIQTGPIYSKNLVKVVDNKCNILGNINLDSSKTLRGIDAERNVLYYSYMKDNSERIGKKALNINWVE